MDCVRQRIATSENVEPVTRTACVACRRTPSSAAAATSRLAASNCANSLFGLKRFEEGRSLMRKTMPVMRRVLGESNEITLKMRSLYGGTLYIDPGATLDDLREAVSTLEETERIARRVFGGAHPLVRETEDFLRKSRRALSDREALLAKYLLYGASALAIAAFALMRSRRN